MTRLALAFLAFLALAAAPFDPCPPLAPRPGPVVTVTPSRANDLPGIVRAAAPGTTILLGRGTYRFTMADEGARRLRFERPGVTLRGVGDASGVVIDAEYRTREVVYITASDVVIANITIEHAADHLIHITPAGAPVTGVRIYGVTLRDGSQQFVKANPDEARKFFTDGGRLECSRLVMTAAGRALVRGAGDQACYTGGLDLHGGAGWRVAWSRFEGIFCERSIAEHCVHAWRQSRDTLVENNVFVDCARGVGLGLGDTAPAGSGRTYPDQPVVGYVGHYGGIVRNNVIVGSVPQFDTGVELQQARGALVEHNTIVGPTFRAIDSRYPSTIATIRGNLVSKLGVRDGAVALAEGNTEGVTLLQLEAPATGDYRLKIPPPALGVDMRGVPRKPDTIGAYEP